MHWWILSSKLHKCKLPSRFWTSDPRAMKIYPEKISRERRDICAGLKRYLENSTPLEHCGLSQHACCCEACDIQTTSNCCHKCRLMFQTPFETYSGCLGLIEQPARQFGYGRFYSYFPSIRNSSISRIETSFRSPGSYAYVRANWNRKLERIPESRISGPDVRDQQEKRNDFRDTDNPL